MFNSLWSHVLQHTRLPCPSPSPGVCWNSRHIFGINSLNGTSLSPYNSVVWKSDTGPAELQLWRRQSWFLLEALSMAPSVFLASRVHLLSWTQESFLVSSQPLVLLLTSFSSDSCCFTYREKAMAPHSSTLAWKIPWVEEPGRLQSMGSWRVGHDWATSLSLFTFVHWRGKWQPTPVFLPGESQGWGSLVGCRLWGYTESDTTEAT